VTSRSVSGRIWRCFFSPLFHINYFLFLVFLPASRSVTTTILYPFLFTLCCQAISCPYRELNHDFFRLPVHNLASIRTTLSQLRTGFVSLFPIFVTYFTCPHMTELYRHRLQSNRQFFVRLPLLFHSLQKHNFELVPYLSNVCRHSTFLRPLLWQ